MNLSVERPSLQVDAGAADKISLYLVSVSDSDEKETAEEATAHSPREAREQPVQEEEPKGAGREPMLLCSNCKQAHYCSVRHIVISA